MSNFVSALKVEDNKLWNLTSKLQEIHFQIGSVRQIENILFKSKTIYILFETEFSCLRKYIEFQGRFHKSNTLPLTLATDYMPYQLKVKEFSKILSQFPQVIEFYQKKFLLTSHVIYFQVGNDLNKHWEIIPFIQKVFICSFLNDTYNLRNFQLALDILSFEGDKFQTRKNHEYIFKITRTNLDEYLKGWNNFHIKGETKFPEDVFLQLFLMVLQHFIIL